MASRKGFGIITFVRCLALVVALVGSASASRASIIYSISVGAPSLGPGASISASVTLPTYFNSFESLGFPPGSSTLNNAANVASVTYFSSANISFAAGAYIQFPYLLYTDILGTPLQLNYVDANSSNSIFFTCSDGAPCSQTRDVTYVTVDFGGVSGGTVPATFSIIDTSTPEPGGISLAFIGLGMIAWTAIRFRRSARAQ